MLNDAFGRDCETVPADDVHAIHRIRIERSGKAGQKGQRYSVIWQGETIIDASRSPALDACRFLLARGFTGKLIASAPDSDMDSLQVDIETGAKSRAAETEKRGPHLVRWQPFDRADVE